MTPSKNSDLPEVLLVQVVPLKSYDVPEILLVQKIPFEEVRMVPEEPTVTKSPFP